MFVYIRSAAFIIVVTQKLVLQQSKNVCCYAKTSSSAVQKRHSKVYGNPIAPSFYSILLVKSYRELYFNEFWRMIINVWYRFVVLAKVDRLRNQALKSRGRLSYFYDILNYWFIAKKEFIQFFLFYI